MDFATLTTDTQPLLEQAGLRWLKLSHEYCATFGHFYHAYAYRGTAILTLVGHEGEGPARTMEQLQQRITDALLDQLSAYYANAVQL